MDKGGKRTPAPLAVSTPPASPSAQVMSGVLEKSAPPRRLTHDVGFHRQRVTLLASAFQGTHLLTGSADGTVRLWETASGRCERVFFCRESRLGGILTTPGRNRMITVSPLGAKKVWDLENGDCLADLPYHDGTPVHCDDTHFFCRQNWNVQPLLGKKRPRSKRSEVLVCEVDTGRTVRRFEIDDGHISSLAVGPGSERMAVVSDDHCLRIWDLASAQCLHQSQGHYFQNILGITPDNRSIILRSGGTIDVRDMAGLRTSFTMAVPSYNHLPRYVLRGFLLIERTMEFTHPEQVSIVRVIDVRTGATLRTGSFRGDIEARSITEDGRFCLGFRYGVIDVWDMENHRIKASVGLDPVRPLWNPRVEAAPLAGERIALSPGQSTVHIIDPPSGQPARALPACDPVRDVLVTPDGKGLLTMGTSTVKHWDLAGGGCLREFAIPTMPLWDDLPESSPLMAVTPDGKGLLLPSGEGAALRELSTGRQIKEFSFRGLPGASGENDARGPYALYLAADGRRLMAVPGRRGAAGYCDLHEGASAAVLPLKGRGRPKIFRMGEHLFATSYGDVLSLWDAQTGELVRECDQGSYIVDVLFLPSRAEVVTTNSSILHFWDCATGKLLAKKPHDSTRPIGLHNRFGRWLSPVPGDRQFIVHCHDDIALWDVEEDRFRWRDDDSWRKNRVRRTVAFPDGQRFAAVDVAGIVEVRSIETGETLATLNVLPEGFIWETPPDDRAPSGWLWTDREDLVSIIALSKDNRHNEVFHDGDSEHATYLNIYNNRRMVMAKVAGKEQYRQHLELYSHAFDRARIGNGSIALRPALS